MRVRLIVATGCASMVLLATPLALATPGNGNGQGTPNLGSSATAKACAAAKKADTDAFKLLWGKHAMRDCIRAGREAGGGTEGVEEATNAAEACRAEQAADPDAFAENYGTNHNHRNAFGKCVSTKVHDEHAEG
jgi:hypothetical protein